MIAAASLTGCTQNDSEKSADQLNKSKQANEQSVSNDGNDTASEKNSETVVRFEKERSFGSTDEILIGEIATIVVDEKSRVYIADKDQATIHVFSPEGNYLTSLGREGRGPGEFTAIYEQSTTMNIFSNRLYITDYTIGTVLFPHRVNIFSLEDFSFSHSINLNSINKEEYEDDLEGHYLKKIYPQSDGLFLAAYQRPYNEYLESESLIKYVIQDSARNIISEPIFEQKDLTYLTYDYERIIRMHSFPFFEKSQFIASNDYFYLVNTKNISIDVYDLNFNHVRKIEHPFENKRFNKNEILEYYDDTNYMTQLGYDEGQKISLKMIQEAENLPDYWPAIQEMLIDDENRLWVSTIVEDFDIYEWWVLEETGELITKFEWPRDEPIEVVRNGKMYTRETDEETGLQQLVRYRVEMEEK